MKTIILNGSPKVDTSISNSRIFAEHFVKDMINSYEIKYIANESPKELAKYVKDFDSIIMILPLYIHAMPGIVMKFIEHLEPATSEGKHIGFIVQAGFIETAQHKYLEPYFADLAKQLGYYYLGTVSKGESAAVYMFPKKYKKVLKLISDLGMHYEKNHSFDKEIVKKLSEPYNINPFLLRILKVVNTIGLDNIGWHHMLKKNNAFEQRLDRPFI